jgi:hypothetical protein
MVGPFCAQCGERKVSPADYSLSVVAHEVAEDFAHVDSKILRTLGALLFKPGLLSKVYFAGGRSRYTKPLTLFVILNIIFFVVQPHTGLLSYKYGQYMSEKSPGNDRRRALVRKKLLNSGERESDYVIRFNARLQEQKKSMLIFSVPMLALAMTALFFRKRRFFVEHLVFSIHVYAFLLISLLGTVVIMLTVTNAAHALFGHASHRFAEIVESELGISLILGTALVTYIFLGLRKAYAEGRTGAVLRALAMTAVIMVLTGVYHDFLFYATYFTT